MISSFRLVSTRQSAKEDKDKATHRINKYFESSSIEKKGENFMKKRSPKM